MSTEVIALIIAVSVPVLTLAAHFGGQIMAANALGRRVDKLESAINDSVDRVVAELKETRTVLTNQMHAVEMRVTVLEERFKERP